MKGMSGGVLVVLDRLGRPSRRFPLTYGLATIGRDPDNDIRIVLPDVVPHHATVLIHDAQAVIRSTSGGVTLVNGRAVSVAPLRHGDEISVGGRALRWEYSRPRTAPPTQASPALAMPVARRARGGRERRSAPSAAHPRDRAVQLALEMAHRASMPGSTGGKQVAIVQPQRRDAAEHTDKSPSRASPLTTRRSNYEASTSVEAEDKTKRKSLSRASPRTYLQTTTKATLWIESRKPSPRKKPQPQPPSRRSLPNKKSTPLRMTVLKRAQSAHKPRKVIKIEAPLEIDHTKQAAIMLMTGHTPKSKLNVTNKSANKKSPSYLVKKPSPVRKTPRGSGSRLARGSSSAGSVIGATPSRGSDFVRHSASTRTSKRYTTDRTASILEISDSTQNSSGRVSKASRKSPKKSPTLPSPKKSAMKDQSKKSFRKTESIKFDLSNLDNYRENGNDDYTRYESDNSEDITLRFSESSVQSPSPSPRRSIHSRSERMLENVGTPLSPTPASPSRTLTLESPSARRSLRGNVMLQKVLDVSSVTDRTRSDLSTSTLLSDGTRSDLSAALAPDRNRSRVSVNTIASDRTRSDLSATLAPDRTRSRLTADVDPDRTRSDLSATLASDRTRSRLSANVDRDRTRSDLGTTLASDRTRSRLTVNDDPDRTGSDLSASLASDRTRSRLSANTDPDRTRSHLGTTLASDRTKSRMSANATVASAFRTRTLSPRHNLESYSVVDLVSFDSEDATKSVYGSAGSTNTTLFGTPAGSRKTRSTIDPVLLGSSTPYPGRTRPTRSKSNSNVTQKGRVSNVSTRRSKSLTTPDNGQPVVVTKRPRASRSRSRIHDDLSVLDLTEPDDSSPRTSKRSRTNASTIDISNVDSADRTEIGMTTPENRNSPEAEGTPVLSIRSWLDSSHASFASTVKDREEPRDSTSSRQARRSRLRLSREPAASEDEGVVTPTSVAKPSPESVKNKHSTAKKPQSKRTIIDDLDRSDIVKQLFDSPVKRKLTQSISEFSRKRLFDEVEDHGRGKRPTRRTLATAESAPFMEKISTKKGKKSSSRRRSAKNDLTDVRGVKAMFGKSQKNDLRRVTGVGKLFRKTSPRNDLTDVRGVREMFRNRSPVDDLRDVSGVKRVLRASPRNDLTDVRGVRRMFKENKKKSYQDVSGIEELFKSRDRSADAEELFDELVGRPPARAVYSRTFAGRAEPRSEPRRRSLRVDLSIDLNNVEEWLQHQLKRRLPSQAAPASRRVTMELKKLATDTVEGTAPVLTRRTRNSSIKSSSDTRGNISSEKRFAAPRSPARAARPVQRAVHSTPLKGRLQITMNASELGRVSPIAGPSRDNFTHVDPDVSISIQSDVTGAVRAGASSPGKQKSPEKVSKSKMSPAKSPKRASRNKKASEKPASNTRKRRSSLVVTKKAPVMSPKVDVVSPASQERSPAAGTSRPRARAARPTVVVTKPSPKLKPRSATKTADSSPTSPAKRATRKVTEKKTVSPKMSPKGKKKTSATVSKNEPPAKARKTKLQDLVAVEEPSQPKRARRGNDVAASSIEEKQSTRRGRKNQNQTNAEPEVVEKRSNKGGRRARNLTNLEPVIEEKATNTRGKKAQTQTSVRSESEEKRPNSRKRKTQIQTPVEPEVQDKRSNNRGRKTQNLTISESVTEEKITNTRRRKAPIQEASVRSEPVEKLSNSRGRKAQNQTVAQSDIEEKRPIIRGRRAQNQTIPQPVIEETKNNRRNARAQTSVESETVKKVPNNRGRKIQNQTIPLSIVEDRKINTRDKKAQHQTSIRSETEEKKSNTRGKKVQFDLIQDEMSPRRSSNNKQEVELKTRRNTAQNLSEKLLPAARSRSAKADVTVTEKRGKRKAPAEVDLTTVIPPKRGKTTETPAKKAAGKQKGTVSKDEKANSKKHIASTSKKQETAKPTRATKSKTVQEPGEKETTRSRGRKTAEAKEKVESTRGKRKANVDPSPAKTGAKKAANKSVSPAPAPGGRARRAVRGKPGLEAATKAVRFRRR